MPLRSCATDRQQQHGRSPTSSRCSAGTTWRSSCGITAIHSTRPATTRSRTSPARAGVECIATNNVHYAQQSRRPLATALAAVRARRSLDELDGWLPAASTAHLRAGFEQQHLFRRYPGVVERAAALGVECAFDLQLVAPDLPPYPCPNGLDEMQFLRQLAYRGRGTPLRAEGPAVDRQAVRADRPRARPHRVARLPRLLPHRVGHRRVLPPVEHLLPRAGLGGQQRGLLRARHHQRGRGRRSACCSNGSSRPSATDHPTSTSTSRARGAKKRSSTCTSATTASTPRRSPTSSPTGRSRRSATWRRRSATRPASRTHGRSRPTRGVRSTRRSSNSSTSTRSRSRCSTLAKQVEHFPRHLGIHSGGMVICDRPIVEVCPIEWGRFTGRNGTGDEPIRSVLQWDKDDCAAAGLVKFDLLGLGMLSALHHTLDFVHEHHHDPVELATIPQEDAVYDMLCRADSVGVFQVESRAQMATLPRLKPALLLRPRRRGGAHPARADPGRLGAPVHPAAQRHRAGHLPAPVARSRCWRRRSACRCSKSNSCRSPSRSPGSRPARPISSGRRWRPSAAASAWSASASGCTTGWPSGASSVTSPTRCGTSSRPSPTTASPRATR